ncbi:biopolymer transporter ExbD [Hyphomicrobium sp. MC1]|uniref:ExbD/TolR family protein n=1 Tax=Hyphomicrobium sp. (strain MC1) TaxID=717785 RepID=UPI000213E226|nr:biopolymer transporter ExbD [Hyphomicrobium sp. MC1]CCB67088.1 uptake of enterobactin; tonB-dependent uptake of B colicins [Hyphomicrobium sp. MC1]
MGMAVGNGSGGDDDGGYKPLAEINVTPFVDVMLVLLIIFMVAAPLMVQGVPLELPKTTASKIGAQKKPMVVSLAPDGKLYIRDEEVMRDTLVPRLEQIKAQEGDAVVYVRADRKIPYGDVMELLGRVGDSGYARVSLLSQPAPSSSSAASGAPPSGATANN